MKQQIALWFQQPMVPAEFGYSLRGSLAAIAVALGIAALLYSLTVWPAQTAAWLAMAGLVRFVGRHPIAAAFR
jgi:hypothetical protein